MGNVPGYITSAPPPPPPPMPREESPQEPAAPGVEDPVHVTSQHEGDGMDIDNSQSGRARDFASLPYLWRFHFQCVSGGY